MTDERTDTQMNGWTQRHTEPLTVGDGGDGVLSDAGGHRVDAGGAGLSLERVVAGGRGRAATLREQLQVALHSLH